jgi:multiple sugar transport system substrate-binding protein
MKKKTASAIAVAAAAVLALSACGSGGGTSAEEAQGELSYWLWDPNQRPAYQQCADDFHKANPDITVKVTQRGWDDYWATLTNGFVAGNAPDIFTNHLTKYPELIKTKQLLPLDDALKNDPVDLSIYNEGLAELWVGEDGKRYGLPKDWDTVAVFYNKTMTTEAGISEEQEPGGRRQLREDHRPPDGGQKR